MNREPFDALALGGGLACVFGGVCVCKIIPKKFGAQKKFLYKFIFIQNIAYYTNQFNTKIAE